MSELTTITNEQALDIPIEPVQLVDMWEDAARSMIAQGQPVAAGAFTAAARQLRAWIRHEGNHVAMCMPRNVLALIQAAMSFDPDDKESWSRLGRYAHAVRTDGAA